MDSNITLRPARKEDLRALWSLCLGVFPEVSGSSLEEFSALWQHRWGSPFRMNNDLLGWVLENASGEVKGFISYIPLMLRNGQELTKAHSVSTWVVDPVASAQSLDLFRAFGKLDNTVCLLDTTANKIASLMCKRLKMEPIGVKGYQRKFIWIIDPMAFLIDKGYFGSSNNMIGKTVSTLARGLFAWSLKVYLTLKGHRISDYQPQWQFKPVEKFGPEFDRFWDKIKLTMGTVQERTSQFMNWRHFNLPCLKGTVFSFVCKDSNGEIIGYLTMKQCGRGEGGEKRFVITDVLFLDKRTDVFQYLMAQAYAFARSRSAACLECYGFNEDLMDSLLKYKPIIRQVDHITYWFKAPPTMGRISKMWVSAVDGDMNL